MSLSKRGNIVAGKPLRIDFDLYFEALKDVYHRDSNPLGKFLLNIAENKLCWDLFRDRIEKITRKNMIPEWVSGYTASMGHPSAKEALCEMISTHIAKTEVDPQFIGLSAGATSVVEVSSFLLGDPGDTVVFPAPSYPVYENDIGNKPNLKRYDLVPEKADWETGKHLITVSDLDRTYAKLASEGQKFRVLVITTPDNPTGSIYPIADLIMIANWCVKHEIHLVINEIYALSLIDTSNLEIASEYAVNIEFVSFLAFMKESKSEYLHWWYSLSKDFGISGFRVGVVHSYNQRFMEGYNNINAPQMVSNYTQWVLEMVFRDTVFIDNYIKINQKRLTESYIIVVNALKEIGVPYIPSRGSLFVWIDLSNFLQDQTEKSENLLWRDIYNNAGVLLTPGNGFGHRGKGLFRVVFTCVQAAELEVAFGRFKSYLKTLKD